jgi:hypothetical protein
VTGLLFAMVSYLAYDVFADVPFMLFGSLEANDYQD